MAPKQKSSAASDSVMPERSYKILPLHEKVKVLKKKKKKIPQLRLHQKALSLYKNPGKGSPEVSDTKLFTAGKGDSIDSVIGMACTITPHHGRKVSTVQ